MDEEYSFYEEDINKVNWPKFVIIFLLILIIIGGYFGYKYYVNNNKVEEETNEVSVTDPLIQKLYNRYNMFTTPVNDNSLRILDGLYGYYYYEKNYTSETISSEVKILTAINELFLNKTLTYEEGSNESIEIAGKVMRDTITSLFGDTNNFEDTSIDPSLAYFCDFGNITYDSEKDLYYTEGSSSCNTTNVSIIKTKLVRATKEDDTVTFVEEMAYLVPEKNEDDQVQYNVYDEMEENDLTYVDTVNTLGEFAFYNYKHLHNYKYTFVKNGDNYVLSKIERIK